MGVPSYTNHAKGTTFMYQGYGTIYLEVKDYSKERKSHELRPVLIGSSNSSCYMYHIKSESNKYCSNDYVLYTFWLNSCGAVRAGPGQKKLMIQVSEDGDNWITMDTKLLCVPIRITLDTGDFGLANREILTFRVDFYG